MPQPAGFSTSNVMVATLSPWSAPNANPWSTYARYSWRGRLTNPMAAGHYTSKLKHSSGEFNTFFAGARFGTPFHFVPGAMFPFGDGNALI